MRKYYLFLLLVMLSILMLSACGENDATTEDNSQDGEVEETNKDEKDSDENQTDKVVDDEEDGAKETNEISNPTGVKGIFQKAAEVMSGVQGMNLTGEIISTTDMMGIADNETSQITGEIAINPFAQHLNIHTVSDMDGTVENEMYITEKAMYMTDPESGGWFSMSMEQGGMMGDVSAIISESQFHRLAELHELFELKDDSDHYMITFEGTGEEFKGVAFGALKDIAGDEAYQSLTGMITEISGTYEFTIDKDTFYVVAMKMDV